MAARERRPADQGPADRLRRREVLGRPGAGGLRAELRPRRQPPHRLRRLRPRGLRQPRPPLGRGLLQDAGDPLGPRRGQGPAVLLLRLRRRRLRGLRRLADRRVPRRPRRHPPRRRPLAEPGDRQGPDRGRLHPGHGLADHRGAVVGQGGPPAHPRAVDLQDPARLRPPAGLQRRRWRSGRRTASRRSAAPRRSASRRSCSASRSSRRCRWPSPASPTTRPARASRPRRRPSAS